MTSTTRFRRRSCEISSNEAVARYADLLPKLEPHHRDQFDRILVCQAIEHGLQFVTLGPMAIAKANIDAFKDAFAKRGRAAQPKAEFPGGAAIGVQRHIFIADTDEEASGSTSSCCGFNWSRSTKNRDSSG